MFVSCVHSRVVEGSGVGSAECEVHVVCMERVLYVVGGCNVVATTEHGRYDLSCMP